MRRLLLALALAGVPMQGWNASLACESDLSQPDENPAVHTVFDSAPVGIAESKSLQILSLFDRSLGSYFSQHLALAPIAGCAFYEVPDWEGLDGPLHHQRVRWQI